MIMLNTCRIKILSLQIKCGMVTQGRTLYVLCTDCFRWTTKWWCPTTVRWTEVLKEERKYILDIVKQIKKAGCNVLLIQKSILRDAVSDLALHFLAKMKIMVVKDVEREEIEFICKVRAGEHLFLS